MKTNLRILLVMNDLPLESGFLAEKFIRLSERFDVHLLVWGDKSELRTLADKYHIKEEILSKIYFGPSKSNATEWLLKSPLKVISNGINKANIKNTITLLPYLAIKPDIIHFEFGTLAKNIRIIKEATKAKIIVSFRGYDINYVGLDVPGYYDDVWNFSDGIHFLGQDLKTRAIKRGYTQKDNEALIPPSIDTQVFQPDSLPKQPGDKLRILSTGRVVWKKGYEYAIQALSLLKQQNIPFEYRIIGDGPHIQAVRFAVEEYGLNEEVVFLGKKTAAETKQELSNTDIFLHPAISEGFCNAVIEAQAMQVPVVCTDADGLPENIEDGITGYVVPRRDTNAIAATVLQLWNNKEKMQQMGLAGRQRVLQHFRIEDQIEAFSGFYKKVNESR